MVRTLPTDDNPLIHPAISFSLLAAAMAAAMAIITTLCGVRSLRKSPPSPSPSTTSNKPDENASPSPNPTPDPQPPPPAAGEEANETETGEPPIKCLPLPPKLQAVASSGPVCQIAKSASERKLNHMRSMSIRIPRSLSVVKNREQKDEGRLQRKREKMKIEESVWTKTIILGEKCRVPDEEDAVLYDGKGKKVAAYHPRAPSSMSITMSRQSSFIDSDAIPNHEPKLTPK